MLLALLLLKLPFAKDAFLALNNVLSLLEKSGLARHGEKALQSRLPPEPPPDPSRKKWLIDDTTTP